MFNSKFRLLIVFILLTVMPSYAAQFHKNSFKKRYDYAKFSIKAAVNNLKYVETTENYTHYFKKNILDNSVKCFKNNQEYFTNEYKKYKVSPYVVLGILTVESHCGKYVSEHNIVEAYKSLITLKFNKRIREKVYNIIKNKYPSTLKKWFLKRVDKKYNWARKEIGALKIIYLKDKIDIFKIHGSWAGAFGLPQFIPTTFINFAVDGNNDGKIDIFSVSDAVFSIGNYLRANGWRDDKSYKEKLKVIYTYNHSRLYCETVLKLAKIFKDRLN